MSNNPTELLIENRNRLLAELQTIQDQYNAEINELNRAIVSLGGGKTLPEIESQFQYDDQNPNYIKGSFEEI